MPSFYYAMREFAKAFYKSQAWKNTQAAYKKQAGGLCERCKAKGLIVPGEIVHHKIHLSPENINDPNISLSSDNLELLCRGCHAEVHTGIEKRFVVDALGRVTAK